MSEQLEKAFKKLRGMCVLVYSTGFVYFAIIYLMFRKRIFVIPQTPAHPMSALAVGAFAVLIVVIVTLSKNRLLSSPPALIDMKTNENQMKTFGLQNADPDEAKAFGWFTRSSLVLLAIAEAPDIVAVLLVVSATFTDFCPVGEKTVLYACILIVFGQLLKLTVFPTKQGFIQFYRNLTEAG